MRKDSEIFLKKVLKYRQEIERDSFTLSYQYFKDIPSFETAIHDILNDLIINNCLTSKSMIVNLEGDISINLTLDGITYFDEVELQKDKLQTVINVTEGGQINIANGNSIIDATQNNNRSSLLQEDYRDIWMEVIVQWCKYIDIDNWEIWTSYLLGSGLPRMQIDNGKKLDELRCWMLKRIWPEAIKELKETMLNFYAVLNDFLVLFHEHSKEHGDMYYTEKFYHIDHWDTELYDKLLLEFQKHVNLVEDLVLELTRAANYVCDMVRKYVDSNFRIKEGKIVVVTGPNIDLSYDTLRPEYRDEDRNIFRPYRGLEMFKKDRYKRDFCFGDI